MALIESALGMSFTSRAFCVLKAVQLSNVAIRVRDFAHVYVESTVRLCLSRALSFTCNESYQESPVELVGLMFPYCGNGRIALVSVVVVGKLAKGSLKPAFCTAADPIGEFSRV